MTKRRSPAKSLTPAKKLKSTENSDLTSLRTGLPDEEAHCSHGSKEDDALTYQQPKAIVDLPRELLAMIAALLAKPRDKMRFGSCCRLLKAVIEGSDAWTNIDSVVVDVKPVNAHGSVNDDSMPTENIAECVAQLLERVTLKHLSLYKCFDPDTYRRSVGLVLKAASKGTVTLQSLLMSAQMEIGAPYATVLMTVFASSLRDLMIMESDLNAKQTADMWRLVGDCRSLQRLTFLAGEPEEDRSDPTAVVDALKGKHLRTLGLNGVKELSTADVVRLVETLPAGLPSKLEVCYSEKVSLTALGERLSVARRQCVLDFEFAFIDTFELDAIYALATTFPNLRSVDLDYWTMGSQTAFPTSVIRCTIGKFLACIGRSTKINMLCEAGDLVD
uniref:F-box domain-containing protein n=1 Tax=Plectus sambesii TaxID=2011161 RepID=A0A914UHK2_9BILA